MYQTLGNAGIQIIACEVYQKKQLKKKVGQFDGVLFFSPSQFDAFIAANELKPDIPAFCIGRTTATHVAKFNHKNIIVSKQASEEAILKSVYNFFKKL